MVITMTDVAGFDSLSAMPDTFRFSEALEHMNRRQFYNLRDEGRIVQIARGLYRKSTWRGDEDLAEISSASPQATIALRSALARHDLIDDIPDLLDIAIPRGRWAPRLNTPIRWHRFDPATFTIGRDTLATDAGTQIGIYSAPRSIIDSYRLHHREGIDLANDALKRWLRQGGQPSELLSMARSFPRAQRALQQALAILL
ncbi:type IV toxin-antitoxin system AbiEi family antitoxin domain-containing protein [Mycobacterium sp. NPDC003449]